MSESMKILIFDDSPDDIKHLKECIHHFFKKKHMDYHVDVCTYSEMFFSQASNYDLIFLDIELGNENGINLGMIFRSMNEEAKIIITSSYAKYLIDGYKIKADRYFLKPIVKNEFNTEMELLLSQFLNSQIGFIDPKINLSKLYLKDVIYVEFINRKSYLHMNDGKVISTNYPLKYWADKFEAYSFAQPHKSFLVHLNKIKEYKSDVVILTNNDKIPVSRHYRKSFYQYYIDSLHHLL